MDQIEKLQQLIYTISEVRTAMMAREAAWEDVISKLPAEQIDSARNLIRYLALRTFNLRETQAELSNRGLSSIGHSERYTLANVDNILNLLHLLVGEQYYGKQVNYEHQTTFFSSWEKLRRNTERLFGSSPWHRPHIMVTMPAEAAEDTGLVHRLVKAGMTVARINCSHDDPPVWSQIINNVRAASAALGKDCGIYMDLAGPKIRTGVVGPVWKLKKKGKKQIDYLSLQVGDLLHLHAEPILGQDAQYAENGELLQPARIAASLPEIFRNLQPGHHIWFDDGRIGSVVRSLHRDYAELEITHTGTKGGRLRAEKGINLPETQLDLPALTEEDLQVLPFVAQEADIVGYSFVRRPDDVQELRRHLLELGREDIGLVLKIENQIAFKNLPDLLLAGMQHSALGVMLARGDLAVEVGWERISEVQEQILWICEAAHVPIIWATQVLESLAKRGMASRAEITDAAMSNRAECVMLNKGPFIVETVQMLGDILNRMYAHRWKKQETLRELHVARDFFEGKMGDSQ